MWFKGGRFLTFVYEREMLMRTRVYKLFLAQTIFSILIIFDALSIKNMSGCKNREMRPAETLIRLLVILWDLKGKIS